MVTQNTIQNLAKISSKSTIHCALNHAYLSKFRFRNILKEVRPVVELRGEAFPAQFFL